MEKIMRFTFIVGACSLGSCGFTQYDVMMNSCPLTPGGQRIECKAECSTGKTATGGGWDALDVIVATLEDPRINRGRVLGSAPVDGGRLYSAWKVVWEPHPRSTGELHVWAVCADVGSI